MTSTPATNSRFIGGAQATGSYLPGIDSLRALAVVSVLIFHLFPQALPGGFTGVDIFFVISGYVVTGSLWRDQASSFKRLLLDFYSRRWVRIYPALLVCLVVTFALAVLFIPPSWLSTTSWATGLFAFFGLSNLALVRSSDGYFSPRVEFNPFAHTWSLGVEEQFYFVFPLLLVAWLRIRARQPWLALCFIALPAIFSLLFSAWASRAHPDWAFYHLPSRLWELSIGAFLNIAHQHGRLFMKSANGWKWVAPPGVLLLAIGLAAADPQLFPMPWALAPTLGCALVIVAVASAAKHQAPLGCFTHPWVTYIGRISFSLYLWHWPIYVLFRWTIGLESPGLAALAAALAVALGAASHAWIETPTRRRLPLWEGSTGWPLGKSWLLVATLTAVSAGLVSMRPLMSLSTVARESHNWYPGNLPAAAAEAANPATDPPLEFAGRQLFVIGDSHVGAYSVMLQQLERDTGIKVKTIWQPGCAAAWLMHSSTDECAQFLSRALARVKAESRPGDVTFLPGMRGTRLSDQWTVMPIAAALQSLNSPEQMAERELAYSEADAFLDQLQTSPVRIIIESPKPTFAAPLFRCVDWFNRDNPVCKEGFTVPRELALKLAGPARAGIVKLRLRHPDVAVWDPFPVLCPGKVCSATNALGQPLFFDGDHITPIGNRELLVPFLDALRKAVDRTTGKLRAS